MFSRLKLALTGSARNLRDQSVYQHLTLAAFLAWIGLGSDGLSSSCYGPPEAFIALHSHPYLGVFVALATALTIFIISTSYSQIIEQFPAGGGGYVVASKLLTPALGAVSGCALLVDYVLTIAISIASGADALFSFLPVEWQSWKLTFAACVAGMMIVLNLRGVRESVLPLVPVFLIFVLMHIFVIIYAAITRGGEFASLPGATIDDTRGAISQFGVWGMLLLIMHSYSMGAGTYTGIEAVSNGMSILREPRVKTAKKTMTYMWVSLAVMAVGLMLTYLILKVSLVPGKTLNAVMLEKLSDGWNPGVSRGFVIITLLSEAMILFIAAQTGFFGGPRIMANMAKDRWMPIRFSMLSDRLVIHNGILLMGVAAVITIILTRGSVDFLVVLYSINVFLTFALSQSGMVRHWWTARKTEPLWKRKLAINGLGLLLTLFILVWVTISKFYQGGWVTLAITGTLIVGVMLINRHYLDVGKRIGNFDRLARNLAQQMVQANPVNQKPLPQCDPNQRTAVFLVQGFNGMGLHTVQNVVRYFGDSFKNMIFVSIGLIDVGNFKGVTEVGNLERYINTEARRYVELMQSEGYYSESYIAVGTDIADELADLSRKIADKFPNCVFFSGQLIFPNETPITRWLHNNISFTIQKRLYREGLPFVVMPFRVQ